MNTKKIPSGKKVNYDDDLVVIYDSNGNVDYQGIFDYCPYKHEDYVWNEAEQCYDLPDGYKMIGL